jgi:hypothetical protein
MNTTNNTTAQDKDVVIEWAPYIAKEGVSEQDLIQASNAVQAEFLEKQKGYIKRELLKGEGDQWVDLVYWASHDDAQQAMLDVHQSPVCLNYFGMMATVDHDDPSKGVFHYRQKAIWG